MPNHELIITYVASADYGDVDLGIVCPGVTDACAEWVECKAPECPGNTDGDDTPYDVSVVAHGRQHRYVDEGPGGYWSVRSGLCYVANHGHDIAGQAAERHGLGDGRYEVTPEFDDGALVDLVLADTGLNPPATRDA